MLGSTSKSGRNSIASISASSMISMRSSARSALKLRDNRVKREQKPPHGHYNGLTQESRGNGGGLRPRVWLRLRAFWGQLDPGWNLTIGRRSQYLLVLGHMKRTQR